LDIARLKHSRCKALPPPLQYSNSSLSTSSAPVIDKMLNYEIQTGFWVDHSRLAIIGATITLPIRAANILVSTLTLAVTLSAGAFWTIFAFGLHWHIIRDKDADPFGIQQQVILRNASSAMGTIWQLLQIRSAWSKTPIPKAWGRTLRLVLPVLLIWILFSIAGIFVSAVASQNYSQTQVLIKPQNCGSGNNSYITSVEGAWSYEDFLIRVNRDARAYARDWYANFPTYINPATAFPVNTLPYNTTSGTPCPFDSARCLLGASAGFTMTSSLLDSHSHFGVNALPKNRVQIQKNVTCAVIHLRDVVKQNGEAYDFYLGPYHPGSLNFPYTYRYNTSLIQSGIGYILRSFSYHPATLFNDWDPIPGLKPSSADLSVFFISQNGVFYHRPVQDPLFLANVATPLPGYSRPNAAVTAMGCVEQHSICNPSTQRCTDWAGVNQLTDKLADIDLNDVQYITAMRLGVTAATTLTGMTTFGLNEDGNRDQQLMFWSF
jgi:hypothetical protein